MNMERKLIKQGGGGYTIYLPKKWIDLNKLQQGDRIDLEIADNCLIIKNENKDLKKEIDINITTNVETSVRTLITNAYRLGYNVVKVHYADPKILDIIDHVIKTRLLGYEIISSNDDGCVIENITEPSYEHAENIFLKVMYNITLLLDKTEEMLKGKNCYEEVLELERKIQQFDNFVRRATIIERKAETPLLWIFHTELIHAQREIFLLARYLSNTNIKVSKDIKEYFNDVKDIFQLLKEGYLKKDIKLLEQVHDLEKKLVYKEGYLLLSTKKGKEQILVHRITNSIRTFYLASSPLIGLFLWQR